MWVFLLKSTDHRNKGSHSSLAWWSNEFNWHYLGGMGNLWVATPLKKKNTSLFQKLSVISRALRKGRALWVPSSVQGQTLKGPNPLHVSCRKFQLLRVHEGNDHITTRRQHSPMLLSILIFLVLELFFFLWAGVCLLTGSCLNTWPPSRWCCLWKF